MSNATAADLADLPERVENPDARVEKSSADDLARLGPLTGTRCPICCAELRRSEAERGWCLFHAGPIVRGGIGSPPARDEGGNEIPPRRVKGLGRGKGRLTDSPDGRPAVRLSVSVSADVGARLAVAVDAGANRSKTVSAALDSWLP